MKPLYLAVGKLRDAIDQYGFSPSGICAVGIRAIPHHGSVSFALKHYATGAVVALGTFCDAEAVRLSVALLAQVERMRNEMVGKRSVAA